MPESWPDFLSAREVSLYRLLLDFPLGDIWHIRDLLVEEGLDIVKTQDYEIGPTLEATSSCLAFINNELRRNPNIFPPKVLRSRRYPLIRQMRDVHEFDVGSHLVYCHALAIRRGPIQLLRSRGLQALAGAIERAIEQAHPCLTSASSVFHDFFKCFRTRRPLPAKIGPARTVEWRMPDGTVPLSTLGSNEESLALALLPYFFQDEDLCTQARRSIEVSGEVGKALYELLAIDGLNEARAFADGFWARRTLDRDDLGGIFIGIVDWQGKGYARYLVTSRKKRKRSLEEAGTLLYGAGEKAIRS